MNRTAKPVGEKKNEHYQYLRYGISTISLLLSRLFEIVRFLHYHP